MRATRLLMGMPITVEVVGAADDAILVSAFAYFEEVDRRFSTYRVDSEIAAINRGSLCEVGYSGEMREVLALAEQTKRDTDGYFDIRMTTGPLDPSGIVKGWAIRNAALIIAATGARDFYIDAGGDIQTSGRNAEGNEWTVGIRNPFNAAEIIKIVQPRGRGVATSGTYVRGQHIYDPHTPDRPIVDIVSLTVIGADVLEADRFATAAFAMGGAGIEFIERREGLEGYVVDRKMARHLDQRLRRVLRAMMFIDRVLDHITMYRLVLYYLAALLAAAFVLASFGVVPHDPLALAFSTGLILSVCWITNRVFARVFAVPANSESIYITALILVLILDPVTPFDHAGIGVLVLASVWAMASKFIFAVGGKHLFNPAAFGVVLPALLLNAPATWWVGGNLPLMPVVLLGGFLVIRKIRRFDLVASFVVVNVATVLATTAPDHYALALTGTFQSSPLLFFAFVMLTEPLTAPTSRWPRLAFAALVGFLFAPNVHIGSFFFTPEIALLIGNLFAYVLSPKGRFVLTLERIEQSAADTYDFIFHTPRRLAFEAGQYLEWTLGVNRPDSRGNRRYFTVASAPTEEAVRLGVKFYPESSAFKRALVAMAPGDAIHASQVAGDFTLPPDPQKKLAFLAGGIGITPFRSMLQYLLDRNEERPIVILYGNETCEGIAYRNVLEAAERELGIPTVYAVAKGATGEQYPGYIDTRLVRAAIPDFRERTFYISGPQAMVKALRHTLHRMGVRRSRIKVDFFPGFA